MNDKKNEKVTKAAHAAEASSAAPRKGAAKAAAAAGLACALALGGTLAYFTATDTITNSFGVVGASESGKEALAIDVTTPSWDASDAQHLVVPGVTYALDPVVANTEGVDAWCMLKVSAPAKAGATSADDALFDLGSMGAGWKELKAPAIVDGNWVAYYGYEAKVAEGNCTPALFSQATYKAELTADDVAALPANVTIACDGMAIQAQGFADVDAAFAATGWAA